MTEDNQNDNQNETPQSDASPKADVDVSAAALTCTTTEHHHEFTLRTAAGTFEECLAQPTFRMTLRTHLGKVPVDYGVHKDVKLSCASVTSSEPTAEYTFVWRDPAVDERIRAGKIGASTPSVAGDARLGVTVFNFPVPPNTATVYAWDMTSGTPGIELTVKVKLKP